MKTTITTWARKLGLALAEAGLTVLAFCPSRVSAERMIARLSKSDKQEDSYVCVYRSGLSGRQREKIEQGLRERTVRLVFSTSALELGIDIGSLDVVLCIGLPNSMMSLWQRAGRSARGGREGATVLIPANTPIDTYFSEHPEELFGRDHEPLVLNLTNQRIVCQHYACAVQEIGGDEERLVLEVTGPELAKVHQLRSEGKLNRDEFYRADPHIEINIRTAGEGSYSLMLGDDRIGDIGSYHLIRESYRNAIYRRRRESLSSEGRDSRQTRCSFAAGILPERHFPIYSQEDSTETAILRCRVFGGSRCDGGPRCN